MIDTRDMRDPQQVGEVLFALREEHPGKTMSELADILPQFNIPRYDKNDSVGKRTADEYFSELIEGTRAGVRESALRLLELAVARGIDLEDDVVTAAECLLVPHESLCDRTLPVTGGVIQCKRPFGHEGMHEYKDHFAPPSDDNRCTDFTPWPPSDVVDARIIRCELQYGHLGMHESEGHRW